MSDIRRGATFTLPVWQLARRRGQRVRCETITRVAGNTVWTKSGRYSKSFLERYAEVLGKEVRTWSDASAVRDAERSSPNAAGKTSTSARPIKVSTPSAS